MFPSYYSFKRLAPDAFNVGLKESICTALPWSGREYGASLQSPLSAFSHAGGSLRTSTRTDGSTTTSTFRVKLIQTGWGGGGVSTSVGCLFSTPPLPLRADAREVEVALLDLRQQQHRVLAPGSLRTTTRLERLEHNSTTTCERGLEWTKNHDRVEGTSSSHDGPSHLKPSPCDSVSIHHAGKAFVFRSAFESLCLITPLPRRESFR